jgi:hypothetical protein
MLKLGLKPRFVRYIMFVRNASTIDVSLMSFPGVARIAFDVQSYRMKMDVMPSIDLSGNLPVKSV